MEAALRDEIKAIRRDIQPALKAWRLFADYPLTDEWDDASLFERCSSGKGESIVFLQRHLRKALAAYDRLGKLMREA